MTQLAYRDEAGKGGPLFLATLWMAICVALLCALAPLGPPSSKLTGSAFNPATTSVLLKARSPAPPMLDRVARPDGDDAGPMTLSVPVLAIAMLAMPPRIAGKAVVASPPAAAIPVPAVIAHHPPARAPPLS